LQGWLMRGRRLGKSDWFSEHHVSEHRVTVVTKNAPVHLTLCHLPWIPLDDPRGSAFAIRFHLMTDPSSVHKFSTQRRCRWALAATCHPSFESRDAGKREAQRRTWMYVRGERGISRWHSTIRLLIKGIERPSCETRPSLALDVSRSPRPSWWRRVEPRV
jgi:hypothetical protein